MIPKFRAKSVVEENLGDWIYGSILVDGNYALILNGIVESNDQYVSIEEWCTVDIKTIGQSTGVFDKNGVEIFEGDVIRCEHRRIGTVFLGEVKYDNRYGFWGVTDRRYKELSAIPASEVTYNGYISDSTFCEVIGNIYENPELVEAIR